VTTSSCSILLIYRPQKDKKLSWPNWLTYSGQFTHISGHPSAVSRAQDSKSSPVKDQRSTAEPRNQPLVAKQKKRTIASQVSGVDRYDNSDGVCYVRPPENNDNQMLACDDIMPTGWTPAAASSTLEEWMRTFSRGQQCSCFRITVFYGVRAGQQKVCEWGPKIWKI